MSSEDVLSVLGNEYSISELTTALENGTIEELIQNDIIDLTDEERTNYLTEFQDAIVDWKEQLKEVEDQLEDEIDDLKDADASETRIARVEAEIDELEELMEIVDEDLYEAVEDVVVDLGAKNVRTDEDVSYNPSKSLEDGETAHIQLTGGTAGIFEDDDEDLLTDLDGDGMITYRDQELLESNQDTDRLASDQCMFLCLEPEDVVQSMTYQNGILNVTVYNSVDGKTTHLEIEGLQKGVSLYLDSANENFIEESTYKSLPEEIQALMYFGDDPNSVLEHLTDLSTDEELSFIDNFDEILAQASNFAAEYAITNGSAVTSYVEDGLRTMFNYLNDPDAVGSVSDAMAEFITSIAGLEQSMQEEVLMTFVMLMYREAGQDYTQALLSGTSINQIENVFLGDDNLSTNEKMVCLIMEMSGVGQPGLYGAQAALTTNLSQQNVNGTLMNVGGIFAYDGAADMYYINDEHWAADEAGTMEALELYQQEVLKVSWIADGGEAQELIDKFADQTEREADNPTILSQSWYDALENAKTTYHEKAGKDHLDGIDPDELNDGVNSGIAYILSQVSVGSTIDTVILALRTYLMGLGNNVGDIAAGIVYALDTAASGLFARMLEIDPSLKQFFKDCFSQETREGTAVIDDAKDTLNSY